MTHRPAYRKLLLLVLASGFFISGCGNQFVLLHPAGPVANSELHLIATSAIAMGAVLLVVFGLFAFVLVRFRDIPGNKAPYTPEWHGGGRLETILFAVPIVIVTIIAVPTVQKTYALNRLPPQKDPLVVDVTSIDWKWVFEYPAQHVATVNYVEVPAGVPVVYELTAQSPMNAFWVPQLGGMEYTMSGMVLPLWLEADHPGVYWGRSAQFSGPGFAEMSFYVKAVPPAEFASWVSHVKKTAPVLTMAGYRRLLSPGTVGEETYSAYPMGTFPQSMSMGGGGPFMVVNNKNQ